MKKYIFMSFRKTETNKNLGVCIVKANNLAEAIKTSHAKNINPGGEVLGSPLTQEQFNEEGLELNKLYSRQDMIDRDYKVGLTP